MKRSKNIAILFFSRRAEAEINSKQWLPKANRFNTELASSLILQTYNTVSKTGLPVFHFHEGIQKGESFGERFAHAFESVFELGFDAVIAVGNDSPGLAELDWKIPVDCLEEGQCVLGPTHRRGSYLIALTREHFHRPRFEHLPWQTGRIFEALEMYCSGENEPMLLDRIRDLNSFNDLQIFTKSGSEFSLIKRFIRKLIQEMNSWISVQLFFAFSSRQSDTCLPLRAPPHSC